MLSIDKMLDIAKGLKVKTPPNIYKMEHKDGVYIYNGNTYDTREEVESLINASDDDILITIDYVP